MHPRIENFQREYSRVCLDNVTNRTKKREAKSVDTYSRNKENSSLNHTNKTLQLIPNCMNRSRDQINISQNLNDKSRESAN